MTDVFEHRAFDGHEKVIFVSEPSVNLKGIIAIHNTVLGPAAGGCRMYPYATIDDALYDVLRLSRGMTMKNAAAGLPLGGGKCVVIADPGDENKEALLRTMAKHVQDLGGHFWTAIDVGVSSRDVDIMAEECDYMFARASDFEEDFQASEFTSLGGFHAVRAVAKYLRETDELEGLRVAIQGVGQTGYSLTGYLVEQGAEVIVTDVDPEAVDRAVNKYGVTSVDTDEIYNQEVDIFSPCAMGGILNDQTIPQLKCAGIAGLANNQLERKEHGQMLLERNIAYAPDFVANAGGVMGATMPIFSKPNKEASLKNVGGIYQTVLSILNLSKQEGIPTEVIAERMAMERINQST